MLPQQIQTIVNLAAEHQEKAPEFLDLLNVIVKVEGLGLTLKRNQVLKMQYSLQYRFENIFLYMFLCRCLCVVQLYNSFLRNCKALWSTFKIYNGVHYYPVSDHSNHFTNNALHGIVTKWLLQAYVMKFIMQDYNKLAYVLDQPREFREKILTMKMGKNHLKYLINLIDLLATCAEVCSYC